MAAVRRRTPGNKCEQPDPDPAQADDAQTWQAEFDLPADGGLNAPETLSFKYEGFDALGNTGHEISAANAFQVYQGDLPPLETPTGLSGVSRPGGKIKLSWNPVAGAAGYRLYRRAPEETELTAYGDPQDGAAEEFIDQPAEDGDYTYAIASL